MKFNITILILLSFLFNSAAQELGKIEVINDTTQTIDEEYFSFSNTPTVIDDSFMKKAFSFDGKKNNFQISELPKEGFTFGFWFLVNDNTVTQNLIFHSAKDKNKNTSFELLVDSSSLVLVLKDRQGTPGERIKKSKDKIQANRWYYVTLYSFDNILNLKIRSTGYQFDALEKFTFGDSDSIFFGNNQNNNPMKGKINKVTFGKYSDRLKNKLRGEYNNLESSLYTYHRKLGESNQNERNAITKDTVRINQQNFFIEIWDYSEYDGDEIKIQPSPRSSISKMGMIGGNPGGVKLKLNSKKKREKTRVTIPSDIPGIFTISAIDMGIIEEINTATVRIYTNEEYWDTIHINPNFDKNIILPFVYDPNSKPPLNISEKPGEIDFITQKETVSKGQEIFLRISDFSFIDGDELLIRVNDQDPVVKRLYKHHVDVPFILDQMEDTVYIRANATKLLSCTAKIEIYAKEGKGIANRKITEIKKKIRKRDELKIPIRFLPLQLEEHTLIVRDKQLKISVCDPQEADGDKVSISQDDNLIDNYLLVKEEKELPLINLEGKSKSTLSFVASDMGEVTSASNLCKVIVKNQNDVILAEYILQMPDTETESKIHFKYSKR